MIWNSRIAESSKSDAASMREMEWEEAQSWANFILMKPEALPARGQVAICSMRPEAPPGRIEGRGRPSWTISNRACHRLEVASPKGRIRAKQFLYDWAPPAFDHPSLWRDRPTAFGHNENVCWVGKNYLKQHAASLHRARTMIEVAVLSGNFADEELAEFCEGFEPVSVNAQKAIEETSLAHLCYQSRHSECPIVVPTGYWFHQRENLKGTATLTFPGQLFPRHLAERISLTGFGLDGFFLYGDIEAPREADLVFTARHDRNEYLRLLTWPSTERYDESRPPKLDEQPCATQVINIAGRTVFHAFLIPERGPHEVYWQEDSNSYICLAKPSPAFGAQELLGLLEFLVPAISRSEFSATTIFNPIT